MRNRKFTRFIYLDYDGCCHPDNVYIHPKKGIFLLAPGHQLFEWLYILEELLTQHPEVGIILSTSWVSRKSFSYAKKQLSPALQASVIGATFHSREMEPEHFAQLTRARQILADVTRRRVKEEHWIAIDDDAEGWPLIYARNLVRTGGGVGLSDTAVQAEIKVWLTTGSKTCAR